MIILNEQMKFDNKIKHGLGYKKSFNNQSTNLSKKTIILCFQNLKNS